MKKALGLSVATIFLQLSVSLHAEDFPRGPEHSVTPGSLCGHADARRYPERVPYCNRDVSSGLKREIFRDYDQRFGYRTTQLPRAQFKIDHLIPLCMGGSNERNNLWPQHETI